MSMSDDLVVYAPTLPELTEEQRLILAVEASPTQKWTGESLRLLMQSKLRRMMELADDPDADLAICAPVAREAQGYETLQDKATAIMAESPIADLTRLPGICESMEPAPAAIRERLPEQTLADLMNLVNGTA